MAHAIEHIAQRLKTTRLAKGLSQRSLAKLAGVPQSHISSIESGVVDLRLSSLIEIARALDLEVELVPRKNVAAVQSIVRAGEKSAPPGAADALSARELRKLQDTITSALDTNPSLKELAQLQSRVRDLQRLALPPGVDLSALRSITDEVKAYRAATAPTESLRRALSDLQVLRNSIAHQSSREEPVKPAYSLEDDDA